MFHRCGLALENIPTFDWKVLWNFRVGNWKGNPRTKPAKNEDVSSPRSHGPFQFFPNHSSYSSVPFPSLFPLPPPSVLSHTGEIVRATHCRRINLELAGSTAVPYLVVLRAGNGIRRGGTLGWRLRVTRGESVGALTRRPAGQAPWGCPWAPHPDAPAWRPQGQKTAFSSRDSKKGRF